MAHGVACGPTICVGVVVGAGAEMYMLSFVWLLMRQIA